MSKPDAKALFIAWLARDQPLIYARTVAIANKANMDRKLSGLGSLSGWLDTLVGAAVAVGGTLIAKKQNDKAASLQKKQQQADLQLALLDVNTRRAQAGLAPVDLNGNVIPSAALPMPAAINRSEIVDANSLQNYTPWLVGGAFALVGVFLLARNPRGR